MSTSWNNVNDIMPIDQEVVLISVRALDEYGVVSAWWNVDNTESGESCWVALDDWVEYDFDEVDWWRDMVELPPKTK